MQSILLQIDDAMAQELETVAPAKTRSRARFIRLAFQKALMDLRELSTREAYERAPQPAEVDDVSTWGEWAPPRKKKSR